jgi:hypothetical protein
LKIFFPGFHFDYFFDDWEEVGQGAHGSQRRSIGGPGHAAYGAQHESVLNLVQWYAALMELDSKQAVRLYFRLLVPMPNLRPEKQPRVAKNGNTLTALQTLSEFSVPLLPECLVQWGFCPARCCLLKGN